ncbi:N-acetylmuramoyl-L-alanine amidase CwlD [Thermoflavimicrobium daqui]|uniref:N-acetylmuramoyl-L-alanine amidase CwlD n=1 Tax=Thermoflavimicrobium daqui TaxID=2137476 RepID=A0A364K3B3_9BACL|nr:N-acetylmuramoyl-L-alanine amidase CwlD [Thermoflavimicrobium daqui]RAL23294.1 N-acetylmuramoyl-L-alanine amidase CwlD [Thermoflavimicrobium daqui]
MQVTFGYKLLRYISWVIFGISIALFTYVEMAQPVWSANKIPLIGKVIVIDPGHGGPDGGAVSKYGIIEKEITLKISSYLRDYLVQSGAKVVMTREKDMDLADSETNRLSKRKTQDLIRRIQLVKKIKPDTFISIHLNAYPSAVWNGAQTFYYPVRDENKKLATFIQSSLIKYLGNTTRVPKPIHNVFVLKQSPVPTALVEAGFLSNHQEAMLLSTSSYQEKIAAAIYYGILDYYSGKKALEFAL